ncbi:hypothetical protein ACTWJ8_27430 [Streptomyces sp. SDT5-1]|uniref:hypothetical protein n=1 Tax=Streptomyces sp. SDT5-1 TaxID=3406418 RepID=UPI003FD48B65
MASGKESIPDEEWERFLREAEAGAAGAPEEPSARARMVTRRLAEQGPGAPEPWRGHQPPRRRRGKGWYVVGLLAAAALVVVALDPGRVTGWFGFGASRSTPLATESTRPSGPPPTQAAAERPTLREPFRSSPAARWRDGRDGIGVPEARATGWMSESQVEQALRKSLDFLEASNLDASVLRGKRPTRAIALMNPHQRDMTTYLSKAFRTPTRTHDPVRLFSRFDPSKVRLVGDVVRTRGRITYEEGERGALQVTTDVTYVYPVAPADQESDQVARTIVRREVVMSWDDPKKIVTEPGTFSVVSYRSDTTNAGCGTPTGYLTPTFDENHAPPGGPSVDPYDRSTSLESRMKDSANADCGTATRS